MRAEATMLPPLLCGRRAEVVTSLSGSCFLGLPTEAEPRLSSCGHLHMCPAAQAGLLATAPPEAAPALRGALGEKPL